MRVGRFQFKRRILVGLILALTATGVWWTWTRSRPPAGFVAPRSPQPFVRLANTTGGAGDQVLGERAEYFDPTPLFFPTDRNFGQTGLPESMRRQPGQVFGSFEAKFTFADQNIKPFGEDTSESPGQLEDLLSKGNQAPFSGMGQDDLPKSVLAERSGYLEVRQMENGDIVAAKSLNGVTFPRVDYMPMEFIAVVSSAGLISEPVLVAGSGKDDVDTFVRSYLVKSFHLGERLSPGLYRILVGP